MTLLGSDARWVRLLWIVGLVATLMAPGWPALSQAESSATLTVLRGGVAVLHPDGTAQQPAPTGTVVAAGDEIRTLSSTGALITFFTGTEIEMGEQTILVVERVSKVGDRVDISLKQVLGVSLNRVQALSDPGSSYQISAGGAVAVIRGTTFLLQGPDANGIVVLVCEADCDRRSTFVGQPMGPFLGYTVQVSGGNVVSKPEQFAPDRSGGIWNAGAEAATAASQSLQGSTPGGQSAGVVPGGSFQEASSRERDQDRERHDDDKNPPAAGTATPTPTSTVGTASGAPTATPTPTQVPGVPAIAIADSSIAEGDAGTRSLVFTVTLSQASSQAVTVQYATANGTAVAGTCGAGAADFQPTGGTLTFAPGQVSQTIAVPVCGDAVHEPDETLVVQLSNPSGATLARGQAQGTITNDDAGPVSISINDVTKNEADVPSNSDAVFSVTLSRPSPDPVTVDFATADGTAYSEPTACGAISGVGDIDYNSTSGQLVFNPGETSKNITVSICQDNSDDQASTETFFVNLSNPVNAVLADAQGVGQIVDDDPEPAVFVQDASDFESAGGTGQITVSVFLENPAGTSGMISDQTVTVNVTTTGGTATAGSCASPGSDYQPVTTTLTFPPGTGAIYLAVTICNDAIPESPETFQVVASNPTNATLGDPVGVVTIQDDD